MKSRRCELDAASPCPAKRRPLIILPARHLKYGVALAMLATISYSVNAAEITYQPNSRDAVAQINISGKIEEGDAVKFDNIVKSMPEKTAIVVLASPGGMLADGLEIGTSIHNHGFLTVVDGARCASTCGLIWLAGIERYAGPRAEVGFHAVYIREKDSANVSSDGNAIVGTYVAQLGFSYKTAAYVTTARPDDMKWLKWGDRELSGIAYTFLPHIQAGPDVSPPPVAPEQSELNARLNASELRLREKVGDAKVEALIAWVKAQAAKDATLFPKLYAQADPYAWAYKQMEEIQVGESIAPSIVAPASAAPPPRAQSPAQSAAALTPAYARGREARINYERWFTSLPEGSYRDGAIYWASNRSVKGARPVCTSPVVEWMNGCNASQSILAPIDAQRNADPNYWWGWNSL
jgi:hypothetical protein